MEPDRRCTGPAALAYVRESLFDVANQLGMWVAPDRGILVFTPVLLVLLPGAAAVLAEPAGLVDRPCSSAAWPTRCCRAR